MGREKEQELERRWREATGSDLDGDEAGEHVSGLLRAAHNADGERLATLLAWAEEDVAAAEEQAKAEKEEARAAAESAAKPGAPLSAQNFGVRLSRLRERRKVPRHRLASSAFVSPAILGKIEDGDRSATLRELLGMAEAFGLGLKDFVAALEQA